MVSTNVIYTRGLIRLPNIINQLVDTGIEQLCYFVFPQHLYHCTAALRKSFGGVVQPD